MIQKHSIACVDLYVDDMILCKSLQDMILCKSLQGEYGIALLVDDKGVDYT
jgi:hypothetical protein